MMATACSRPGPSDFQLSSKTLHPIYQAIDSRNFAKALKLTAVASSAEWDIVKSLRVHALERSGKKREALLLLWDLLTSCNCSSDADGDRNLWSELVDRIEVLSDAADLVSDATTDAIVGSNKGRQLKLKLMDAVQRLDAASFAVDVASLEVAAHSGNSADSLSHAKSSQQAKATSKSKSKKSSSSIKPNQSKKPTILPPITDETVLQTLSVTLKIEGLYDTMSEMYHQAVQEGSKHIDTMTNEQKNEFGNVLEEAVCVHFKAVCDCTAFTTGDSKSYTLYEVQTQQRVTKYYERMQSTALQLAKYSGKALHFQWVAVASLWYRESLADLVVILIYFRDLLTNSGVGHNHTEILDNDERKRIEEWLLKILEIKSLDEMSTTIATYQQKMALLPRLAESLSFRMIQNKLQDTCATSGSDRNARQSYAPSESDWDIYLETLLVQEKLVEAFDALRGINCSPLVMESQAGNGGNSSSSGNNTTPQIYDEHTIENHVGTILPFTQRKKLERMSQIAVKLGMFKEAQGLFKELLNVFPDQWTYWLGLIDSCVVVNGVVCEEEWIASRAFAKEIISSYNESDKHPALRGPSLFIVELAALKMRYFSNANESEVELVIQLRKAICDYGDTFSSTASCCFADLRCYLEFFVQFSCRNGVDQSDASEEVLLLIKWAKDLWIIHSQSSTSDGGAIEEAPSPDELRERRKKVRTYIFAIQVCYFLAAELGKINHNDDVPNEVSSLTLELLESHAPSVNDLIKEWRNSLDLLPGVSPKDGGQKEVLPGDEIALLASQYLQLKASCENKIYYMEQRLVEAAGLLEEAIEYSPYNPNLKIAAIGVYSRLNAAFRAFEHYQELDIKYIQFDSCSYLILPTLIRGGLYTHAIQIASPLLRFHGSTSKDVKEYSIKSFRKGYLLKAKEMVTFQRDNMRASLQLFQAKGFVMDCATLLNPSDLISTKQKSEVHLGAEKGLCGKDDDVRRAEQLVRDAEGHFNAPSIIHPSNVTSMSDNRDMSINYFEIVHHTEHSSKMNIFNESMLRGHTQGLLVRAVMATDAAKAPKKGKVPKNTHLILSRCKSLSMATQEARKFIYAKGMCVNQVDLPIWEATCTLCDVIVGVIQGSGEIDPNDLLVERESTAITTLKAAASLVSKAQDALTLQTDDYSRSGGALLQLLPDRIVPLFTLIETTARLFALFGWGKRKRATKETAGALANLALVLKDFVSDMLQFVRRFRVFTSFEPMSQITTLDIGADHLSNVLRNITSSRDMTSDHVDPFLLQIIDSLVEFADE